MLNHYKALSLCAAVAMTAVSLLAATPVLAKSRSVVVTAQRVSDLPTRRVSYRDLNLASVVNQRTLDRRVSYAVKDVCRINDYYSDRTLKSYGHYLACSDIAWGGARPQIAAAIARAQAMAQTGNATEAVASLAISVAAPAGS